jgi:hypothetical protein
VMSGTILINQIKLETVCFTVLLPFLQSQFPDHASCWLVSNVKPLYGRHPHLLAQARCANAAQAVA